MNNYAWIFVPHSGQNFVSGGISVPQLGQNLAAATGEVGGDAGVVSVGDSSAVVDCGDGAGCG
jgi:hypothetical protein